MQGADAAKIVVDFDDRQLFVSGFVQNGDLIQTVDVVDPQPYDSTGVVRGVRSVLAEFSAAAPGSQLVEDPQQPLGLDRRLGVLLLDVGEHRDAAAGAEQVAAVAGGHQRADHDAEVGAPVAGDPAEGAGVRCPAASTRRRR